MIFKQELWRVNTVSIFVESMRSDGKCRQLVDFYSHGKQWSWNGRWTVNVPTDMKLGVKKRNYWDGCALKSGLCGNIGESD